MRSASQPNGKAILQQAGASAVYLYYQSFVCFRVASEKSVGFAVGAGNEQCRFECEVTVGQGPDWRRVLVWC